jgi:hypothetical protein
VQAGGFENFRLKAQSTTYLKARALAHPRARPDAKQELLQLNRLLLCLFLELLSVLVEQPTAYAETLTRVIGALQNMQHLANLLRPQQVGSETARPQTAGRDRACSLGLLGGNGTRCPMQGRGA